MNERDKVKVIRAELGRLRPALSGFVRNPNAIKRRLKLEAPALDSGARYGDLELVDLMLPKQRGAVSEVEELFSKLMFQRFAPEMLDTKLDWKPVGSRVGRFVDGLPERFILWASRRPGCRLVTAPGTLMVEGAVRFGVLDGRPQCLYSDHLPQSVTLGSLSEPIELMTADQSFIVLYGRADAEARSFLAAARLAYPYGFSNLAPWLYGQGERNLREQVTKILMEKDRPLDRLYPILVPSVMPRRVFCRELGQSLHWGRNAPAESRERWYLKLVELGVI